MSEEYPGTWPVRWVTREEAERMYPQDSITITAYTLTGHNELCAKWTRDWDFEDANACTCGGVALPEHLKTIADIELARGMQEKVVDTNSVNSGGQ